MRARRAITALAMVILLLGSSACGSSGPTPTVSALGDDAITVGSFNFPESELLATIYAQAMREAGYRVRLALNLGPREFVDPALFRGLVEFVPEYAGTSLLFLSVNKVAPTADAATNNRQLVRLLRNTNVAALAPAPAQDANAFVMPLQTAGRYNVKTLSDLIPVAGKLTFGGPPECPSRPFCIKGLRDTYHLDTRKFLRTDAGGPLTHQALNTGLIDVALLFTTDPALIKGGLLELQDDRHLQPAENVTPLVHREVLERWGSKLSGLIDRVSAKLTTQGLRRLNQQVIEFKRRPSEVAAKWLRTEGIG